MSDRDDAGPTTGVDAAPAGQGWILVIIAAVLAAAVLGWYALGWDTAQQASGGIRSAPPAIDVPTDEDGLRALSRDPEWLARGKKVYDGLCWTCHGKAGEGTIQGPSLRDAQWILEPTALNMHNVIRDGRPGTAMLPMRDWYRADEIAAVTAYVAELARQGGPSDREPEGLHGPLAW